jgi:hypothetical protein
MAKSTVDIKECRRRLANAERLPPGICYNADNYPEEFYPCSELEERVAAGEVSVSWDGTKITDLKTGKITTQESTVVRRPDENFLAGAPTTGGPNTTKTTEGAHP